MLENLGKSTQLPQVISCFTLLSPHPFLWLVIIFYYSIFQLVFQVPLPQRVTALLSAGANLPSLSLSPDPNLLKHTRNCALCQGLFGTIIDIFCYAVCVIICCFCARNGRTKKGHRCIMLSPGPQEPLKNIIASGALCKQRAPSPPTLLQIKLAVWAETYRT